MAPPVSFDGLLGPLDEINVAPPGKFAIWYRNSHAVPNGATEREFFDIVAELEKRNGRGDEAWADAPDIWFFLENLLPRTQRLPLDQADQTELWQKVRGRLTDASQESMALFDELYNRCKFAGFPMRLVPFPDGTDHDEYVQDLRLRLEEEESQWRASWNKQKRHIGVAYFFHKSLMYQIEDQWRFVEDILKANGRRYDPIPFGSWADLEDLIETQANHLQDQHWKAIINRLREREREEPEKQFTSRFANAEQWWKEGRVYWETNLDIDFGEFVKPKDLDDQALRRLVPGDNDPGLMTGPWCHKETVGKGSYGRAELWLQYNEFRRITNRLVTKDSLLNDWNESIWWENPMRSRIPREYAITKALSDVQGVNNTVYCHSGFSIFTRMKVFRMYLEYCEHGTLSDLLKSHQARRDHSDTPDTPSAYLIPVRAMCAILEHLTGALCMMDLGGLPDSVSSDTDNPKQSIVHLDLKPGNVLLSKPHESQWPGVPVSKVADFGASERLGHPDLDHKWNCGTDGYKGPEQTENRRDPAYREPLSAKTNMWSMGRTVFNLMNLEKGMPINNVRADFKASALEFYPDWMINCVMLCLRKMPFQRPTPKMIWELIHLDIDFEPKDTGESLKEEAQDPNEILLYKPDKYKDLMA